MVSVRVGSQESLVSERVGKLILWLIQKADRISILERFRIVVNCAGASIHTELVECDRL